MIQFENCGFSAVDFVATMSLLLRAAIRRLEFRKRFLTSVPSHGFAGAGKRRG
jgi:hypothetical protein